MKDITDPYDLENYIPRRGSKECRRSENISSREERLMSASIGPRGSESPAKIYPKTRTKGIPFAISPTSFSLDRACRDCFITKKKRSLSKKKIPFPLSSGGGNNDEHAGIILLARTRFPVSHVQNRKRGSTRDEATCARDARKLVLSLFLSLSL